MKNSFKKLLNGMLVASTASMASAATNVDVSAIASGMSHSGEKLLTGVAKQTSKKLQKYIIKFGNGGTFVVAGHTSHRSHSSHRSHRSSSGSYYGGGSSSSSSRSTSSSSTRTTTTSQPVTVPETEFRTESEKPKTTKPTINNGDYIFSLGERTLQIGCIGTDVKVLAALLQKHGFILASNIKTNDSGYVIYDEAIAEGVKKFQRVANLPITGIANQATITALRQYGI